MSEFHLLINGRLAPGDLEMPVINPATEEVLATCPRASKRQLDEAVAAAKAAFPLWAETPIETRRAAVMKIAGVVEANAGELARLLTSEQGKPLPDATGEVMGTAAFFRYLGGLELSMKVIEDSPTRRVEAHRRPLGVIGAIIPCSFAHQFESASSIDRRQHNGVEAGTDHASHDPAVRRTHQGYFAAGRV
jgi:acyl-CoA reductase-like NAD-dependent aldehyde dehydrogenase